eukprot:3039307-Amphidinium_carterae.1
MAPQDAKMRASEQASTKYAVEHTSCRALPRVSASNMPVSFALGKVLAKPVDREQVGPPHCGRP